jgi:DNA integrity scanning protein DisA with diadenylate cyclase activity
MTTTDTNRHVETVDRYKKIKQQINRLDIAMSMHDDDRHRLRVANDWVREATADLDAATAELDALRDRVAAMTDHVESLTSALKAAHVAHCDAVTETERGYSLIEQIASEVRSAATNLMPAPTY